MADKKTQGEEIFEVWWHDKQTTADRFLIEALCAIATQLERIADFLRLPASKWSK